LPKADPGIDSARGLVIVAHARVYPKITVKRCLFITQQDIINTLNPFSGVRDARSVKERFAVATLVYKGLRAAEQASTRQLKYESRLREFCVYRRVAKRVYYSIYYKQLVAFLIFKRPAMPLLAPLEFINYHVSRIPWQFI